MDYLVRKIREVKANRTEFACKISMESLKKIDSLNEALLLAKLDNGHTVSNCIGKPQPIATDIVDTFD